MNLHLNKSTIHKASTIQITGSKSESNRLLLLQALYPEIKIDNVSNSDDSVVNVKSISITGQHHRYTSCRNSDAFFNRIFFYARR